MDFTELIASFAFRTDNSAVTCTSCYKITVA